MISAGRRSRRPRISYEPPAESWHYCGAAHVLDVNVTRYYEPRERVVAIDREARPIEHYPTVSNVKVVVGPPPSVLHEHRVDVRPVRVDAKVVGRWTPTEAHAQVARAQEHKATFEVENQRKLDANTQIHAAQHKVIETHPQIKVQVDARVQAAKTGHAEPARGTESQRATRADADADARRAESSRAARADAAADAGRAEPCRARAGANADAHPRRAEPRAARADTDADAGRAESSRAARADADADAGRAESSRTASEPAREQHPAPAPAHVEPARPAPQPRPEPAHAAPAPAHVEPARPAAQPRPEPAHAAPAPAQPPAHTEKQPEKHEPEKK